MSVCVVDVLWRDHIEQWWYRLGLSGCCCELARWCDVPSRWEGPPRSMLLHRQVLPAKLWVWPSRGRRQGLCAVMSSGVGGKDS